MRLLRKKVVYAILFSCLCYGFVNCNLNDAHLLSNSPPSFQSEQIIIHDNQFDDLDHKLTSVTLQQEKIGPNKDLHIYYTFPQCIEYGKEVDINQSYHDVIVYQDQVYFANSKDRNVKAFCVNHNSSSEDVLLNRSETCSASLLCSIPLPDWLQNDSADILGFTQDFYTHAFILLQYHNTDLAKPVHQSIQVIDLSTNKRIGEYPWKESQTIQQIRYLKTINAKPSLIVQTIESPSQLYKITLHEDYTMKNYLSLNQEIISWDHEIDETVVMLQDATIKVFHHDSSTNEQLVLPKVELTFPYSSTKPNVTYNPAKKSFVVWEDIENGSSWVLSLYMPTPSWINVEASIDVILLPFSPDLDEDEYRKEIKIGIGKYILNGPKAWISGFGDFTVIAKTPRNKVSTWMLLGMITADEEIYKEWMDKYSTKSMIDGRYVEN